MIKIYAPASIGNVGVGFDILGIAIKPINNNLLGDCVSIKKSKIFEIYTYGKFSDQLPKKFKNNIIWRAWKIFKEKKKITDNVTITLEKNLPIGSGLGSSSSSIVATLVALNKFYQANLTNIELIELMGELEGEITGNIHYDNVVPCFLGGLQLITKKNQYISQKLPIFKKWIWIIAWPGIVLSTSDSRKALPEKYNKHICTENSRNIATFIHALHSNQSDLAIQFMNDVIAEPYRIKLIPNFIKTKTEVMHLGALNCNISGSGPTIFSICTDIKIAIKIKEWLKKNYLINNRGFVYICEIDNLGARKI